MRRDAPLQLLVSTVALVVIVNLILAQVVVQALYPGAGLRFGPVVLGALGVAAVACAVYTVRGWRSYMGRPPDE